MAEDLTLSELVDQVKDRFKEIPLSLLDRGNTNEEVMAILHPMLDFLGGLDTTVNRGVNQEPLSEERMKEIVAKLAVCAALFYPDNFFKTVEPNDPNRMMMVLHRPINEIRQTPGYSTRHDPDLGD